MGSVEKYASLRDKITQGRLLTPGDEGYENSLKRWSATCIKPAALVIQPRTVEETSSAVKYLTTNKIPFNVKGGGHSTSQSSCAPTPQGAVIDLSLLRTVSVNATAQTVRYGGGCTWADVDDACWEYGLATPGGTVSHTGVGGLVLHGGFGVLSGIRGLTVDCLLEVEAVLASGEIVTASESENSDLFWAVRGAGSSFCVVTAFTSKAWPQGEIWGGQLLLEQEQLPAVVEFFNFWAANNDGRQVATLAFTHGPPDEATGDRPKLVVFQFSHLGDSPTTDGEAFFAPILQLPTIFKKVNTMAYPLINKVGDVDVFPPGNRYLFGGANFETPISLTTVQTIRDKFFHILASLPPTAGQYGSIVLLEGIPNGVSSAVPTDTMAFNSRGDYYNIGIVWTWNDEKFDGEVRSHNRGFQKEVRALGYNDAEFKDGVGWYLNYASTGSMTARDAFGENGKRLGVLKERFDPENVFDKLWKLLPQKGEAVQSL